jgi:Domain of unknown function (DUF397)
MGRNLPVTQRSGGKDMQTPAALDRAGISEPDAQWVKSSLSFSNGNCVEVARLAGGMIGVRHSMDSEGVVIRFTPGEWRAFLGGVRNGEFDSFGEG